MTSARHAEPAPQQGRDRPPAAGLLLLLGWALLLASWVGGQPPGAGPDEDAGLVKALGTATGQLTGDPVTVAPRPGTSLNPFLSTFVGQYDLPDGWRVDVRQPCWVSTAERAGQDASCPLGGRERSPQDPEGALLGREPAGTGLSYVAPYPPLPYLLPGSLAVAAPDPSAALALTRIGSAVQVLALLGLAVALLPRPTPPLPVLGLALAVTPSLVALGSTVGPTGTAAAAGVAAAAAVGRLVHQPAARLGWVGLAVAGGVLALSRPEGPATALALLLPALLLLPRQALARRPALLSGAALGAAVVAGLLYALLAVPRLPSAGDGGDGGGGHDGPGPRAQLQLALQQVVGTTGWGGAAVPLAVVAAWTAAAVLVALVALHRQPARRVAPLLLLAVSGPVAFLVLDAVLRDVGSSARGRYVLPLLSGALVLATVAAPPRRLVRGVVPAVAAAVLVGHLVLRWLSARRFAAGPEGPLLTWWRSPAWEPLGGALPWLALAAVGALLVAAAPMVAARGVRAGRAPRAS